MKSYGNEVTSMKHDVIMAPRAGADVTAVEVLQQCLAVSSALIRTPLKMSTMQRVVIGFSIKCTSHINDAGKLRLGERVLN